MKIVYECKCKGRSHVCELFYGLLRWDFKRKQLIHWELRNGMRVKK